MPKNNYTALEGMAYAHMTTADGDEVDLAPNRLGKELSVGIAHDPNSASWKAFKAWAQALPAPHADAVAPLLVEDPDPFDSEPPKKALGEAAKKYPPTNAKAKSMIAAILRTAVAGQDEDVF